jgi:hypothetical protein
LFLIVLVMALAAWSPTSARDMRAAQMAQAASASAADRTGMSDTMAPCHEDQVERSFDAACCAVSAGIPTHAGPKLAAAEHLFAPIGPAEIQAGRATPPAIPPPKV